MQRNAHPSPWAASPQRPVCGYGTPADLPSVTSRAQVVIHIKDVRTTDQHIWTNVHASLDAEESARLRRFKFDADRQRFALGRYYRRHLLAQHLDLDPAHLRFSTGCHGRPWLSYPARAIDFNASHSGDWIIIAISTQSRVGVDVEERGRFSDLHFASAVLDHRELGHLLQFDASAQPSRLGAWWCAKEAFLKLHGIGLSLDPRDVSVDWRTDDTGTGRARDPRLVAGASAQVQAVDVDDAVICMLACPGAVAIEVRHLP